jgi:hypothetical protein
MFKLHILAILLLTTSIGINLCIDADPTQYPKVVQFAKENVDPKVDRGFRFFKATDMQISETQTGKQYHVWLLYLDKVGVQNYYYVTVYENPWGEFSVYEVSKNGPAMSYSQRRILHRE